MSTEIRSGLSYASRLTPKSEKGGGMGGPEHRDPPEEIAKKIIHLAELIKESKSCVVITGAGISTSAGVADFRGPNGVWTAEKQGLPPPKCISFDHANPTLTHMALVGLVNVGMVKLIVSQNVDGLHLRSGLAKDQLAELHGNLFLETCELCGSEYLRDFDVGGISFKKTGRFCQKIGCGGALRDTLLDWDDALPENDLIKAQAALQDCDLCLCLGTSLRIRPASELPVQAVRRGGKLVICNLQKTPKDRHAYLNIHAPVDDIMRGVSAVLKVGIPNFTRRIHLSVMFQSCCDVVGTSKLPESDSKVHQNVDEMDVVVQSSVGVGCPVPMVKSCRILFCSASLSESVGDTIPTGPPWIGKVRRESGQLLLGVWLQGETKEREVSLSLPSPSDVSAVVPLTLESFKVVYDETAVSADQLVADLCRLAAQVDSNFWGPPTTGMKRRRNVESDGTPEGHRKGRTVEAVPEEREGWIQCHNKGCQRWFRKPTASRRLAPFEPAKVNGDISQTTFDAKVEIFFCRRRCEEEAQAFEPH